jgi:amino acid adenylation domain-containing protein
VEAGWWGEVPYEPAPRVILPRPRPGPAVPLSLAQQRLWRLSQLEPRAPLENLCKAVRLAGRLDVAALEAALGRIAERHESLRTTFEVRNGQSAQVIDLEASAGFAVADLERLAESERWPEVRRVAAQEAQAPFDLARGPLLRVTLLRLAELEHALILSAHPMVFDRWSFAVFSSELGAWYDAFCSGRTSSPVPAPPIQYGDVAVREAEILRDESLAAELEYWKRQLAGSLPLLQFPADRPRPTKPTFRAGEETFTWRTSLTESLEELSRKEGVTLFVTLVAAFKTLLWRYTGQDEIAVAAPVSGRDGMGTDELIGPLENTLVLRSDLSGDPTFRELLGRVREVAADAYAHRHLPFARLEQVLRPRPGLGGSPLFHAMFELEAFPAPILELPGLEASPLDIDTAMTTHDLSLRLGRGVDGLRGSLKYNRDLFDEATVAAMLQHLETLLEGIVETPDALLSRLPLLTKAERHQVLMDWSGSQVSLPDLGVCIHELFEARVEESPDKPAVVSSDGVLTYEELNRQANALAHQLRGLGVGSESLVGLCMERSLEMLVGLFGILKAGAAYVPLDPAYPTDRLAFMLKDANVSVLLTQTPLVDRLPKHDARVVCLDGLPHEVDPAEARPVNSGVTPENLVYVIYTSGSTGTPKGALITHRSLVKYAKVATLRFGIEPGDRILQFCSISFDISVEEIFLCLTRGGTLVLRTPAMLGSVSVFLQECERLAISVLSLPTAFWHEIAGRLGGEISTLPPALRLVIIGGERVQPERLARWSTHVRHRPRLLNTYGLTEASVLSTMYDLTGLTPPDPEEVKDVPIGRPVQGVETYVLDHHLQPVPIGAPGELCIGGEHLARGYLNSPVVTAERFVPNPFAPAPRHSDDPPSRLYRTGDLVRYARDGQIEYIGRIDQQLKVRGFRVEPGEIEAVLSQHPAVSEAVVVARPDDMGRNVLVAYVVPETGRGLLGGELRAFLKDKLPDYMIPPTFVTIEALPLSPNGKVDRAALPPPPEARPEVEEPTAEPRTDVELFIAQTWQEALQVGRVSVHDNFFDLGGYSLLLMGVIEKIEEKLGVLLTPDEFVLETLGQVAAACEEHMRTARKPERPGLWRRVLRGIRGK